ncbi:hypothetical protein DFH08DRAFT_802102 [Mycena albidolilacea]|uniref:Uncharacterized protein n=1 Tax=Mycena albidolilacea TaxID=1033008 RepID=A0AAD7AHY9_9AGAR|nr:hypothetical protein DFH08DRAFT_802102 [Mycena albidolilacea]
MPANLAALQGLIRPCPSKLSIKTKCCLERRFWLEAGTLCAHPDVQHHLNNSGVRFQRKRFCGARKIPHAGRVSEPMELPHQYGRLFLKLRAWWIAKAKGVENGSSFEPSLIPTGSLAPEDIGTAPTGGGSKESAGARQRDAVPVPQAGQRRGARGAAGARAVGGCASCGGVRMQRWDAIERAQLRGGGVRKQWRGAIEGRYGTHATAGRDRAVAVHAFSAEEQQGGQCKQWGAWFTSSDGIRMEWQSAGAAAERVSGHGRMCGRVREQWQARTSVVLCAERLQEVAGCQRWRRSKSATEARKQEAKAQRTGFKSYKTCLAAHWPSWGSSAANGAVAVEGEASKEQSQPTSLMYSNTKQSCFDAAARDPGPTTFLGRAQAGRARHCHAPSNGGEQRAGLNSSGFHARYTREAGIEPTVMPTHPRIEILRKKENGDVQGQLGLKARARAWLGQA